MDSFHLKSPLLGYFITTKGKETETENRYQEVGLLCGKPGHMTFMHLKPFVKECGRVWNFGLEKLLNAMDTA